MKKIPTVYQRSQIDRSFVTDIVTPGCEWVIAGEGVPTRKYDGTCTMYDGHDWFTRREVKKGKDAPDGYIELQEDPETGIKVGWEPAKNSGYRKALASALETWLRMTSTYPAPGTYELIGPKISNKAGNPNPEHVSTPLLQSHSGAYTVHELVRTNPTEALTVAMINGNPKTLVRVVGDYGWEGIVWHHPNGAMAKLKVRDL